MAPPEKCTKCGKEKQQDFSGSLTQWVALCRCALIEPNSDQSESGLEEAKKNTISICLNCGKRIGAGRSGTFTQWIFRSDLCACEKPEPVERSIKALSTGEFEQAHFDIENFDEIETDETNFPLERFAPIEVISSNSNSTIYLAVDKLLRTRVAIKLVSVFKQENLVRFQKEVRALAGLSHPGLVKVLDFAERNGTPYMVMEYVDGVSLKEYLKQNERLEPEDVLVLGISLCQTLAYCHAKNVLHRDIKPGNVLIGEEENSKLRVKLVDFGLASIIDDNKSQGSTVAGTPLYMAPDSGMGLTYDERSDLYSFGCLLFELFTGEPPYKEGNPLMLLKQHAEAEIPTPSSRLSEEAKSSDSFKSLGKGLDELLIKCLAKSPQDRFQTMEELKSSLIALQEQKQNQKKDDFLEILKKPDSRLQNALPPETKTTEKHRSLKPLALVVVSLIGMVIITGSILLSRQGPEEETNILSPEVRSHVEEVDLADEYPIDSWMAHTVALGGVGQGTRTLMFTGPDLNDEQMRRLARKVLYLRKLGLNDCTSVKAESVAFFLSHVRTEEIFLANANCTPAFIKATAGAKIMQSLRLENATPDCVLAIPKGNATLKKIEFIKCDVDDIFIDSLKSLKGEKLEAIVLNQCRLAPGALSKIKGSLHGAEVLVKEEEQ
ncbi:MAG: serine/threonine protein kinase [Cyanobacteria bacterium HKST-UBA01]|nr:serine/threonine protein kinase [Cyanobacteria bacterium HKST-UBA01]